MTKQIVIRGATISDVEKLRVFFKNVYKAPKGREHHIAADSAYLLWHFHNPFRSQSEQDLSAVIAETDSGEVAAFFGSIPIPFSIKGKKPHSGWLSNWITEESYRRQGIGTKLLEKISMYEMNLVSGYFTNTSYPLYLKHGWKQVALLERYITILNCEKVKDLLCSLYSTDNVSLEKNVQILSDGEESEGEYITWDQSIDDAAWENAWKSIRSRFPATTDRTKEYLTWRFVNHPFADTVQYHMGIVHSENRGIGGFVAIRIERTNGFSIARVVDFASLAICDERMVKGIVRFARACNCDAIDVYTTYEDYRNAFKAAGFFSETKKPFDMIPSLFNPLSPRKEGPVPVQTVLAKPGETSDIKVPDSKCWHITKADGDRDRGY